jgi:Spy/CpxP family protein refolding chaperone
MRAVLKLISPEKRLAAILFGAALCLLAPGANVKAQEQAEPPARQQPGRRVRGLDLVRRLNLSREQRQRLREIRRRSEPELRELARRLRRARAALDEAIYADAADDALVEQRSRELSAAQSALTLLRAADELKVRRVLTAEQLQLFRGLRREAQRRQTLQRRMNRALRPPATPPPDEPDANVPGDTQPKPPPARPPAARRRRP